MIDIRPVGYILGWLVLFLGLLMILPMLLDLADRSINAAGFALAAVLAIMTGASVALACASRRTRSLDLRQGFLLTWAASRFSPSTSS